jgi:hypothetical protein
MTTFIILTDAQAAVVGGASATDASAALNPVEREGGAFILNVSVLDDPAHAAHRDYLTALPTMEADDPEFPPSLDPVEEE